MATAPRLVADLISSPEIRKVLPLEQVSLDVQNRPLCDLEESVDTLRKGLQKSPVFAYLQYDSALVTPLAAFVVVELDPGAKTIEGIADDTSKIIGLTGCPAELRQVDDGVGGTTDELFQYVMLFSPLVDLPYTPLPAPSPVEGEAVHFSTVTGLLVRSPEVNASVQPVAIALDALDNYIFTGFLTSIFQGASPASMDPETIGFSNFRGVITTRYALEDHVHALPTADAIICYLNDNATKQFAQALFQFDPLVVGHAGLPDMPSAANTDHDQRYLVRVDQEPGPQQLVSAGAALVSFDNVPVGLAGAPVTVQDAISAMASLLVASGAIGPRWFMRRYTNQTAITDIGHSGTLFANTDSPLIWQADANNKEIVTLSGNGSFSGAKMHASDPYVPIDFGIPTAPDGSMYHAQSQYPTTTADNATYYYMTFDVAGGAGTLWPTFLFGLEGSELADVNVWIEADVLGAPSITQLTKITVPFSSTALVEFPDTEMFELEKSASDFQPSRLYKYVPGINDDGGTGQRYRLHITWLPKERRTHITEVMTNLFSFAGITPVADSL